MKKMREMKITRTEPASPHWFSEPDYPFVPPAEAIPGNYVPGALLHSDDTNYDEPVLIELPDGSVFTTDDIRGRA